MCVASAGFQQHNLRQEADIQLGIRASSIDMRLETWEHINRPVHRIPDRQLF